MLRSVEQRYPARHYVMIDDKLRILDSLRNQWHDRVTTVFPRQGHYAHDSAAIAGFAPADVDHRAHRATARTTTPAICCGAQAWSRDPSALRPHPRQPRSNRLLPRGQADRRRACPPVA